MLPFLPVAYSFSLGKTLCSPFFCWVARTARLYLTDMGSMCAPFLNSTRGASAPALVLHVQAENKLDGRRLALQGRA